MISQIFLIFFFAIFVTNAFVISQHDDDHNHQSPLESPHKPFCKNRLSQSDYTFISFYSSKLESIEPGKRLLQLLSESITKDESRNRHRHGGYKIVQNDDHRMKEIDNLIFKNREVENLRKELRKSSINAFECVDDFEMTAAGRILVEDLETGRARLLRRAQKNGKISSSSSFSSQQQFHRYDGDEDDGDDEDSEENRKNKYLQKEKNKFEKHREFFQGKENDKKTSSSSLSATQTEEEADVDTDFPSTSLNHHHKYHGMHPNEIHLYQHATEHFQRHAAAKIEHERYHEHLRNQRLNHNSNNKNKNNNKPSDHSIAKKPLTPQEQESVKQSFDHMQNHFQQHHHQLAAQRKLLEDQSKKTRELHEARLAADRQKYDSERFGAGSAPLSKEQEKIKKKWSGENRGQKGEDDDNVVKKETKSSKISSDPLHTEGFERLMGENS
jgi:hypothetical protein